MLERIKSWPGWIKGGITSFILALIFQISVLTSGFLGLSMRIISIIFLPLYLISSGIYIFTLSPLDLTYSIFHIKTISYNLGHYAINFPIVHLSGFILYLVLYTAIGIILGIISNLKINKIVKYCIMILFIIIILIFLSFSYTSLIKSLKFGDPSECNLYSQDNFKENCYEEIARLKHDFSLCENVTSQLNCEGKVASYYEEKAYREKNISICNDLIAQNDYKTKLNQEICYKQLIEIKQIYNSDKQCKEINIPNARDLCYLHFYKLDKNPILCNSIKSITLKSICDPNLKVYEDGAIVIPYDKTIFTILRDYPLEEHYRKALIDINSSDNIMSIISIYTKKGSDETIKIAQVDINKINKIESNYTENFLENYMNNDNYCEGGEIISSEIKWCKFWYSLDEKYFLGKNKLYFDYNTGNKNYSYNILVWGNFLESNNITIEQFEEMVKNIKLIQS
ncbi:hypothetical protein COX97_00355 [Candidatus Pacearchaeota archaeon CG_4_10_14_0_2_um_filter_05_32_18]|nr:MAG: hypothetical protein COX97_00355 [Candidatus Pacearchaeota archaeon CG_4_10_14_0_2_um_filter_05_32_18]